MDPNPLPNQLPHDEVIRRFLQRLNEASQPKPEDTSQPKHEVAKTWQPAVEQLVSPKAAEELARWFRK